jgi:hypothetical protein
MSIFSRRRAAPAPMPAPPPPAPVAQPAMPNPYLRNLPPSGAPKQQPGFLGGIQPGQMGPMQPPQLLQPGAQQAQLGIGPMQPPQLLQPGAQPSLIGMQGAQPSPYEINQQRQSLLNQLPAYQQLQSMKKVMEMQSQGNPLFRPSADQMSEINALQQQIANNPQMQALQKQGQAFQQQQPYMPQSMTMDMPQAQRPMLELPTQPGMQQTVGPGLTPQGNLFNPMQPMDDGTIMGRATNMMSRAGVFGNPQPIGPQKMAGGYDPIAAERDYYSRMAAQARQPASPQSPFTGNLQDLYAAVAQQQTGMQQPASPAANMMSNAGFGPQVSAAFGSNMQPQQPNSLGQQFGQAQNPFARPMQQQAFGQSSMPQGIGQSLQQSSGQTQQPSNIMSSKFGSAFGGGTQPQQQPQQPGMQQNNPMQNAGGQNRRSGLF